MGSYNYDTYMKLMSSVSQWRIPVPLPLEHRHRGVASITTEHQQSEPHANLGPARENGSAS